MANFYDPATGAPVLRFKIPKTGTFTIGLFGGGPVGLAGPRGTELEVSSWPLEYWAPSGPNYSDHYAHWDDGKTPWGLADSGLLKDEKAGMNQRLLTFQVERLKGHVLYALSYGKSYFPPLYLETADDIRKAIVDFARTFVRANCHYLWGTAGNTPDRSDGNPGGGKRSNAQMYTPPSIDTVTTDMKKVIGLRMAKQEQVDPYNTCAGRCDLYKPQPDAAALKKYIDDLNEFLGKKGKALQDIPIGELPAGPNNLYPRKYHFKKDFQSEIVWGEACDGIQHFDCVGFVNYCYAFHFKDPNFGVDINKWANVQWVGTGKDAQVVKDATGNATFLPGFSQVGQVISHPDDIMNADVVVRRDLGHIAMVYLDGTAKIVQAQATAVGLNDTSPYVENDWGQRIRVSGQYLVTPKSSL